MREERGSPLVDAAVARTEATYAAGALGPGIRAGGLDVAVQRRRARAGPPAPPAPPGGGDAVCPAGALGHADRRSSGGHLVPARVRRPFRTRAAAPAVILASGLVLIYFFDHPYEGLSGSIQPVAMERALDRMTAIQHATRSPSGALPGYLIDCWS